MIGSAGVSPYVRTPSDTDLRSIYQDSCWGSAQSKMTQPDNIDDFKNGKDITSLPKTIRDAAIYVTRELNLRFLWVHALCILQDKKEDKVRECSKMEQIYQQAYVTIAAARTEDCHDRFFDRSESITEI